MKYTYFICFTMSYSELGIRFFNGIIDLDYPLNSPQNFKKVTNKIDDEYPGAVLVNFILMNG